MKNADYVKKAVIKFWMTLTGMTEKEIKGFHYAGFVTKQDGDEGEYFTISKSGLASAVFEALEASTNPSRWFNHIEEFSDQLEELLVQLHNLGIEVIMVDDESETSIEVLDLDIYCHEVLDLVIDRMRSL